MAQADRSKAEAAGAYNQERVLCPDGRRLFQRAESREARTSQGRRERRRKRFILKEISWMFDKNVIAEAAVSVHAKVSRLGA